MAETRLELPEGDDTLVTLTVHNFDVTGASAIEVFLKATRDAPDGTPKYTLANSAVAIVSASATQSVITIQFASGDVPSGAARRWKVRVTKGGKKTTIAYGPLVVIDT